MDPVTAAVGVLVACYGASVVVAPRGLARLRARIGGGDWTASTRPDGAGTVDDGELRQNFRVFGLLATAIGCYAVALGVGIV